MPSDVIQSDRRFVRELFRRALRYGSRNFASLRWDDGALLADECAVKAYFSRRVAPARESQSIGVKPRRNWANTIATKVRTDSPTCR
jgi:hypothetical protein